MEELSPPPSDAYMRDKIGAILHRTDHALYLFANELLTRIGLTFQQAVVLAFIYHNRGCNQRAVEEHTETRSASVTVLLTTMVSKGLVLKTRSPIDGREVILSLTPKGKRAAGKVQTVLEEANSVFCQGITEEEIASFKSVLKRMAENCAAVDTAAIADRTRSVRILP